MAVLYNNSSLLEWTEEDCSVSPLASMLGAPLKEGRALYPNLQFQYSGGGTE